MEIRRILISQPQPTSDKSPFSELSVKHNLDIEFHPFINVEGVSLKEFRAQRVEIANHTAVIFTSRTAVDNFFRICEQGRIALIEDMKYFCISEAIANYLQKYIVYRKRKIFFGAGNFAQLVDVILKHRELKYLVPLCEPHKPEIPQLLTKAGVKYNKVILAHTVASDLKGMEINGYDIAVFYSPSEIKALLENFTFEGAIPFRLATFGSTTTAAALKAGLDVDIVAPTVELPSMTMALDKFIAAHNQGLPVDDFAVKAPLVVCAPKKGRSTPCSRSASASIKK